MQEGICKNCGSIVFVDPKKEKCHCMFCNCVFPASEALQIAKDPSKYEFPNEEQPDHIPEDLDLPVQSKRLSVDRSAQVQKKSSKKKKSNYAVKKKALPDVNLSKKQIFSVIGIFALIAAIFLVIMLPQTINRDNQREEITLDFKQSIENENFKESIDFTNDFVISRLKNTHVDIKTNEMLTKEQTRDVFKLFCDTRADVMEIEANDTEQIYKRVSLRIVVPEEGGYLIKDKNLTDLEDLSSITDLP